MKPTTRYLCRQATSLLLPAILLTMCFNISCFHLKLVPVLNCNYTINNIFTSCHNPLSSSKRIGYKVDLVIWAGTGTQRQKLDEKTVTVANNGANSVTITAATAQSRSEIIEAIVTIQATQCSTCAETQDCTQIPVVNGITAAMPVLYNDVLLGGGITAQTINDNVVDENVSGSCGCTVPNS